MRNLSLMLALLLGGSLFGAGKSTAYKKDRKAKQSRNYGKSSHRFNIGVGIATQKAQYRESSHRFNVQVRQPQEGSQDRSSHEFTIKVGSTYTGATTGATTGASVGAAKKGGHRFTLGVEKIETASISEGKELEVDPISNRAESYASWSITANEGERRVLATLDEPLPEDTTLVITMNPPEGAHSYTAQVGDQNHSILVDSISACRAKNMPVKYELEGSSSKEFTATRVLTFTISDQ